MRSVLFANLTDRRPAATVNGEAVTLPRLQAGQQWKVALRFTESESGGFAETFPSIVALRASVGFIDARPDSGSYRLQVGSGLSTGSNTTAALAYNATAAQVAAALNGLGGDYSVEFNAGSYLIRKAGGGQIALTVRSNRLRPMSAARVRAYQVDNEWVHELRLLQSPLAFSDSASQILPDGPWVETVVEGTTAPDNSWFVNEVQHLTIPTGFRGTYRLVYPLELPRKTQLLGVEDGPEQLQEALNAILKNLPGDYDGEVTVSNPSNSVARIIFGGEALEGINVPQLQVEKFSFPGDLGDWTFELDLNRAEMWAALRDVEAVAVPFEVEADVLIDKTDPSQGLRTVKLWSVPLTIARPLLYEGLATAQAIDWLRPISPRSYVPFTSDQIITGQQHWVGTIGFGTANSPAYGTAVSFGTAGGDQIFTIDHNLGTEAVHVTVRENVAPGAVVSPAVSIDGPNSVSVAFGSALSAGQVFGVVVTAAGPTSVFQAHTHTIQQIVGLEAILETLGDRLQRVESLIGEVGSGASSGAEAPPATLSLPTIAEIFPMARVRGKEPNVRIQLPPLPRAIYYGSAALSLGTATELPEASTATGQVYALGAAEIYMPARSPRRPRLITTVDAPFVMSDGYEWYPADRKVAGSNVFYPVEMNRTVWELVVSPEMLAPGRKLEVKWSLLLAMVANPELRGVYTLRVRKGTLTGELAFGTASNVEAVTWDLAGGAEEPLFEQRLSLTRSAVIHPFELTIKRSNGGLLSATRSAYGKSLSAPAPQNLQFVLRAELSRFDLENYNNVMGRPVGQIYLQSGEAKEEIANQIKKTFPLGGGTVEAALTAAIT